MLHLLGILRHRISPKTGKQAGAHPILKDPSQRFLLSDADFMTLIISVLIFFFSQMLILYLKLAAEEAKIQKFL